MKYVIEIKSAKLLDEAKLMTPVRVKKVRALYGVTQVNFAYLLNISYI